MEIEEILAEAERYYRAPDALEQCKRRPYVKARQATMLLARELTDMSLPEIGDAMCRDHTTVLHALQRLACLQPNCSTYTRG